MCKGFPYTLEDDKILEYLKLSIEERLQWLEEINEFTNLVLTDEEKKIREEFRNGTLFRENQ